MTLVSMAPIGPDLAEPAERALTFGDGRVDQKEREWMEVFESYH